MCKKNSSFDISIRIPYYISPQYAFVCPFFFLLKRVGFIGLYVSFAWILINDVDGENLLCIMTNSDQVRWPYQNLHHFLTKKKEVIAQKSFWSERLACAVTEQSVHSSLFFLSFSLPGLLFSQKGLCRVRKFCVGF